MSPVSSNTRRRAALGTSLDTKSPQLRKSGTFHTSPTVSSSNLVDPLKDIGYMPRRSPTNPHQLLQLVGDSGEHRVGAVLKLVDRTLSGQAQASGDASILKDPEVLPVPAFMFERIDQDQAQDCMDEDKKLAADTLDYDSGLGSSISGSNSDFHSTRSSVHSAITTDSAITKSFSTLDSMNNQTGHRLSDHATKQIEQFIIEPILKEVALKDFHPLIKDVPRRIGTKTISNLRDLEKTLLFLAPEYSASPSSYISFCQVSIRCLHTTVGHISDQDQRLPTDRPYTNNYFYDLVEQIHRYAQLIAEARERQAEGESSDEMTYSKNERITLKGGISRDGQPLELVREREGKVLPITESSSSGEMITAGKRPIEEADYTDDDGVHRSMARRRKSEVPGDVVHTCRDCNKDFKRPCDLTKHEKTHSRPWKCPVERCRYHDQGWPTEKERDRHINDKHSSTPHQYKCQFQPCTYSSKRESNCKQHMEKAHGWTYVRSKSNGRKKGSEANSSVTLSGTPATPMLDNASSSAVQPFGTPMTHFTPSPAMMPNHNIMPDAFGFPPAPIHTDFDEGRRTSVTTAGTGMTFSSSHSPYQPTSSFEGAITPEDAPVNVYSDFSLFGEPSMPKPAPPPVVTDEMLYNFNAPVTIASASNVSPEHPQLSPGGQGDAMLYSPPSRPMEIDEGFNDAFDPTGGDFTLYSNADLAPMHHQTNELYGGQFNNPSLLGLDVDEFMAQMASSQYPNNA